MCDRWSSHLLVFLLLVIWSPEEVKTGRVLVLLPHIGKSHFMAFEPYLRYLTAVGHDVVVYSHFPLKDPPPNFTDVSLLGSRHQDYSTNAIPPFLSLLPLKAYITAFFFGLGGVVQCAEVLGSKPMQELMKSDEKFDLIVTELFNSDCVLPFVHKFGAPHIALSSCVPIPTSLDRFGNPDSPAYIANMFLPLTNNMNFFERVSNTLMYLWTKAVFYIMYDIPSELVAWYHFGFSIPRLSSIAYNTSLLLINTHPVINSPRPYVPSIIEVGGIHLPKVKKLPQDIAKFMDEAEHGVVYVSFGSLLKIDALPDEKRDAMVHAFARLKQRVLWRWSSELYERPANLMTKSWIPQFDVLNHPNVKAFVTHSGLLGTIEAVHNAVPVVTIPFFGDQDHNAKNIVRQGIGIQLSYRNLTMENLLSALNQVIYNISYKENAIQTSKIFRDRPKSPMETAVYWTEYVLRHGGAPHLQSAAKELNIFQYLLLDVVAVLLIFSIIVLVVLGYCFKILLSVLRPKQKLL
ncbi:UDP-glycosyltransferase UGT5-like [Schistocerca americana]|uniref:UDP-glycosyltransferase UGT5-like n=1 Tax=Schistocerca americana TaxID=7009 RepID=UPI001F501DD4|nr:UDP-glycosyltransferase UGT5-like [Schistocerca americana]